MAIVKNFDPKFVLMFLVNSGLYLAMSLLNDALAGIGVFIFMPAILLVSTSLFLEKTGALLMGIIFGFLFEVGVPVKTELANVFIFAAFCLIINSMREKFRGIDAFAIMWLTWGANILMFIACVLFVYPRGMEFWQSYFARLAVDITISSMLVMLFSSYAINLQKSVCYFFGIDLAVDSKEGQ